MSTWQQLLVTNSICNLTYQEDRKYHYQEKCQKAKQELA